MSPAEPNEAVTVTFPVEFTVKEQVTLDLRRECLWPDADCVCPMRAWSSKLSVAVFRDAHAKLHTVACRWHDFSPMEGVPANCNCRGRSPEASGSAAGSRETPTSSSPSPPNVVNCPVCGRFVSGYCSNGCDADAPYPGCPKDAFGRWSP